MHMNFNTITTVLSEKKLVGSKYVAISFQAKTEGWKLTWKRLPDFYMGKFKIEQYNVLI